MAKCIEINCVELMMRRRESSKRKTNSPDFKEPVEKTFLNYAKYSGNAASTLSCSALIRCRCATVR